MFPKLEGVPQRELDQPCSSHGTGDLAEVAPFHVRESWIGEVGVIPNVKEISSETQLLPLGELEVLDQREVPVLLARPTESVAPEVSEVCRAEVRVRKYRRIRLIRVALRRVQKQRRCKSAGIQVAIDSRSDASAAQRARERGPRRQTAREHAGSGSQAKECTARAGINHRERRTGLEDGDAADGPSRQ